MMEQSDRVQRGVLPIPSRSTVGLTTFDAKDPDTSFPPIAPLRPPEAAGLPEPVFVQGVQQRPLEGVSMAYTFGDADAPDRHETQDDAWELYAPTTGPRRVTSQRSSPNSYAACSSCSCWRPASTTSSRSTTAASNGSTPNKSHAVTATIDVKDGGDTAIPEGEHQIRAEFAADNDHLITPEERYRIAMARQ